MVLTLFGSILPAKVSVMPNISVTAHAASGIWDGTADTSWYYEEHTVLTNENGDRFAVFNISTAEELAGLAKLVRNGNGMENTVINLTADIVLNDTGNFANWDTQPPSNNWTAIGAVSIDAPNYGNGISTQPDCVNTGFSGIFNGNGHTITGMYSMHHNYAGLFAKVSGVVTSVIVKDSYVKCTNTQKVENGATALWETCAGGIASVCDRGIINHCEFDGKVLASGLNIPGYGTHGCYAGGIAGKFSDDESGVATIVYAFFFVPIGCIINPALFLTADGSQIISDPGIYNCINRGTIYSENGTGSNGAGGIVGTGGLYNFHNPDFAVFYCLNLGKVSANHEHVGAIVGNGFKFSEQKSYYTNCARSSENNEATNFTASGMSKHEVAEQMGSSFKYENGEIYLDFDNYTSDDTSENIETETFSDVVPQKNVTMPAPEVTCGFLTHYFGTVVDNDNVSIGYSKVNGAEYWSIEIAADPDFTDIYMRDSTLYDLVPGVTYYVRVQGRSVSDTSDANCEYTEYGYMNITLKRYGSLFAVAGLVPPEVMILLGDVDDDGNIDAVDASNVLSAYALKATGRDIGLADDQIKAADANSDGSVDAVDASIILSYYAYKATGGLQSFEVYMKNR